MTADRVAEFERALGEAVGPCSGHRASCYHCEAMALARCLATAKALAEVTILEAWLTAAYLEAAKGVPKALLWGVIEQAKARRERLEEESSP